MTTRTPTTLVLLDIDGTLVYSRGCGRAATELAMHEVFGTIGALGEHQFRGKTDWGTMLELLVPIGLAREHIEATMPIYNEALGRHFAAIVDQYPIDACPGGLELVAALHKREDVLLGILTGNVEAVAPLKLKAAGYDPAHFVIGTYGSEAHDRALLPPIALKRAEALHGAPLERTVIIGDTPDDIICARSINARCIAVTSGSFTRALLESYQPALVLDSLVNLNAVLKAIFA